MSSLDIGAAALLSMLLLSACSRSAHHVTQSSAATPDESTVSLAPSSPSRSVGTVPCRVLLPDDDGCRVGEAQRPSGPVSRAQFLSTDGRAVFYYGRRESFDTASFGFASVTACPLWEDVFAWDSRDVFVLAPASCGPETCNREDYTGFYWQGLGVRSPRTFRWLPGGYGVDDRFVYSRWQEGPIAGATPATFEVLLCGGEEGVILGRDGALLYRDGRPVSAADAQAGVVGR